MEKYVPDMYQQNIFKVNYTLLKNKGIKCLLFDLDNTIIPYNVKDVNNELKQLFDQLKNDFKVLIFSNSPVKRVNQVAKALEIDCIGKAQKPSLKGFLRVFKEYKFSETEVAIIGDQLFTDIMGGNKIGITTVLVNPISSYDPMWTKPARYMERIIKEKLRKRNLFNGRFYDEKV